MSVLGSVEEIAHLERLDRLQQAAGVVFTDYQLKAFRAAAAQAAPQRRCLYYKTGAGKSLTALVDVALWGYSEAVVVAPPSTHPAWEEQAAKLGIKVDCMSHAKFRMKDTKLSRHVPLIGDEVHMFGGHKGKGWKKLDTLARHLRAPVILASATPEYNDVERVYCIQHVLDPQGTKGGYIEFIYQHCETEANPFGMEPKVTGLRNFASAGDYLSSLPYVDYLPDDLVYDIKDVDVWVDVPPELEEYGYDRRKHRMMASGIEAKHTKIFHQLVTEHGRLNPDVLEVVEQLIVKAQGKPVLIFANHSTVAYALANSWVGKRVHRIITGKTPKAVKQEQIFDFNHGRSPLLIGTASLATGTDGMDKVCDNLIILDDTEDPSLRRQLIGRIMPRGLDTDATGKSVYRINLLS